MNTEETSTVIDRLRSVVRRQCEFFTRRTVPPQTFDLVLDRFPRSRYPPKAGSYNAGAAGYWAAGFGLGVTGLSGTIHIPRPPLIVVVSISYIDPSGATQVLDPALYQVDAPHGPYARYGRVRPMPNQSWPDTQPDRLDAVTVRFRAGYVSGSPEQMDVPDDLVHGQLVMLSELYKVRSESVPTGSSPALMRATSLWQPYRLY